MVTKDVAKELGRLVGQAIVKKARGAGCPYGMKPKRRKKGRGRTAMKMAGKRAGIVKRAISLGTGLMLGSMLPMLWADVRRYLGRGKQGMSPYGYDWYGSYGRPRGGPLWGGHERAMFARMGINPAAYQQRERALQDIAGGLSLGGRQARAWQRIARMPVF